MRRFLFTLTVFAVLTAAAPVLATYNHYEGRSESDDGVEISFKAMGRGSRAVVLVHGWSCDSTYWQEQTVHLAEKYLVITVDLAGHGKSAAGREDYTMEAFASDVANVLYTYHVQDAVVVGHSMGGVVAVETALYAADIVHGVVIIDMLHDFDAPIPHEQIDAFMTAAEADFPGVIDPWVRAMFPADADQDLVDEIAADMAAGDPVVGVSAMRNVISWLGNAPAQLERLEVGLVSVNSDMHPTDVEGNREVVPGYQVLIQEGAGHFLMREQPEEFNALLQMALAELGW